MLGGEDEAGKLLWPSMRIMDDETSLGSIAEAPRHLGIADLLEHDQRPAFVTDLCTTSQDTIAIIFLNASLRTTAALADQIKGKGLGDVEGEKAWARFRDWTMQIFEDGQPTQDSQPTMAFRRILWSRITLKNKWRVISANEGDPWANKSTHIGLQHIKSDRRPSAVEATSVRTQISASFTQVKSPSDSIHELDENWTLPPFAPDPAGFLNFFRSVDWASTPLGPMKNWPRKLVEMAEFVIRDSRPASIYWGPKYVCIYNEAYALLTGSKHPALMGKTCVEGWPESCDALIATMEKTRSLGRSSVDDEWQLFLERMDGRPEECYFAWSVVPIYDGADCVGYVNPVFETTRLRIGERRIAMLNDLGEFLAKANDVSSFWHRTLEGLEASNPSDVPFALLYSAEASSETSSESAGSSTSETKSFRLEGTLGVPEGHQSAPSRIHLAKSNEGLIPCFREAVRSPNPIVVFTNDGSFPEHLLEGIQWRGFGDACTAVAICPLRPTKDESVMGLLMIGLNPRRPYDDDHRQFISLLYQKLATSLASSVLFEEEVRRGRNAAEQAAFDRALLSEQLALRTKEADDVRRRFEAVGEVVPVGLCYSTPEGHLTYANNTWYEITGSDRGSLAAMSFPNCVADQDVQMVTDCWSELILTGTRTTFEFRLKMATDDKSDVSTDRSTPSQSDDDMTGIIADRPFKWAMATVSTVGTEDGTVEMVTISLTDITIHKRTAEEALHRAQQAERLSGLLARFKRMADFATVGLFDLSTDGKIVQANDTFYDIFGMPRSDPEVENSRKWLDYIVEDDIPILEENWRSAAKHGKAIADEIRLKKPWIDADAAGNPVSGQTWALTTSLAVRDSDGNVVGLTGCVTDISVQKAKAQIALERADLLDQVLVRTREAESSEAKFARFAEAAPIGISIMTADGCISYCNETWFKITHHPRDVPLDRSFSWVAQVADEDLHIVQTAWQSIMANHKSPTIEFRMKHSWNPPGDSSESGPPAPTWLMSSYFPEIDESGNVKSIMSCLSDISHFKWAESIQKQRTIEALESKRQQENFIDMTSHEMRNPLSAIVQCADLIVDSLEDLRPSTNGNIQQILDGSIDAAQTIISCAQHQKSIVDDILTLSKLDSDLLTITPIPADPSKIVKEALKMFAAESRRADIKLSVNIDKSVTDLKIEWLLLDPSRLLQVLINLLTNALKFTQTGGRKEVTVTMSASVDKPSQAKTMISYIPTRALRDDLLSLSTPPREGRRQQLYLHFAVQDTGRGLTDEEKKLLFKRFSQASPRTHVQYGGSGLGLFISRELTELQGGEIGVASQPGVGSTFAFYVKTQRTIQPDDILSPGSVPIKKSTKASAGLAITILVVEDNLINQAVLAKQLRNLGCTVEVANHGGEAINFLKTTSYWHGNGEKGKHVQIVLLDIEMPVMDGLTCARTVRDFQRKGEIIGHVPIIAVSANARSEQVMRAKEAGMVSYDNFNFIRLRCRCGMCLRKVLFFFLGKSRQGIRDLPILAPLHLGG